jgi:UDP-N-acetylmuramate dehydrogenase
MESRYPLARLTTIGTGGPARWFARPGSMDELAAALRFADAEEVAVAVVGLGSNLLVADAGFDGLVLRLDGALARIDLDGTLATCGGGASLAALVRMNAGAYGGELKDVLAEATIVSAAGVRRGGPAELELAYRHSNVVAGEVVAEATLRLAPGDRTTIRETVRAMQARRSSSQPRKARTFGSVFKNPDEGRGAGALIEACGLKGHRVGGAQISEVHANFIENAGEATSADVAALIGEARSQVRERFGIELRHEVELLGPIAIP